MRVVRAHTWLQFKNPTASGHFITKLNLVDHLYHHFITSITTDPGPILININ